MALGMTNINLTEISMKPKEIIVTEEIINQGTFLNGTHEILTGQENDSAGFKLTGRASYSGSIASTSKLISGCIVWIYQLDVTHYNKISFYAKKNADRGTVNMCVVDSIDKSIASSDCLAKVYVKYNELPTSYTKYTLDISEVTGEVYLAFVGGYSDSTGPTNSSTSYCDIHIK